MDAMKIRILKFWEEYPAGKKDSKGNQVVVDMVKYTQAGQGSFAQQTAPVSRLAKVLPLEGNEDNVAIVMANMRWDQIEPAYRAWKEGRELPVEGTPLGAWAGISHEQKEVLTMAGYKTVEEFAEAGGQAMQRLNLPNRIQLQQMAKSYLESQDTVKAAEVMQQKDEEIAALKDQMAEMMEMIKSQSSETKKPARKTKAA